MKVSGTISRQVRGHLHNVSPAAFVQMIAIERETCALVVREDGRDGVLYFVAGDLCDARLGELRGEEAAIQILGWQMADVLTEAIDQPPARSISAPLTFVLLEAMRRRDEGLLPPLAPLVPGSEPAADWIAALAEQLEGRAGVCLIDLADGSFLERHFEALPGLDPTLAGPALSELALGILSMTRELSPRSLLEEAVLTCDDLILVLRFVGLTQVLVVAAIAADTERIGLSAIHLALRRLGTAPELSP